MWTTIIIIIIILMIITLIIITIDSSQWERKDSLIFVRASAPRMRVQFSIVKAGSANNVLASD